MGVVASNFAGNDGGIVSEMVHPSSDEWISKHAEASKMTNQQVKKLWDAFQKLGSSSNGELSADTLKSLSTKMGRSSEKNFIDKILMQFPRTENGGVSFQTYCNATKWFSDSNIETRVRGAFRVLNNANAITLPILTEILKEIYTDTSEAVISRTARVFMQEVDVKGQGSIGEEDFVRWVKKMPTNVVEQIMTFDPISSGSPTSKNSRVSSDDNRPSMSLLQRVAGNARNRDWLLLVNKLGFTEEEIKDVGDRLGNKKHDEHLFELLKVWRDKTDAVVTKETLKDALLSSGMEDLAMLLQS
nr:uncharacterized protein LOC129282225 [Lytechinus pictus]